MSSPPTPSPANDSSTTSTTDEVSLRDLYLVLLRGLPIILGLAFVAGAAAFFYNSDQAPVFAAESTVLVTPPPIQIQGGDNLSFSPSYEVSFQTYETLARSQLVLQDAVARLEGVNITAEQLLGLSSIRQLIGPQRPDQVVPLSVIHRVRNADPELAARLADAWAQSTLAAVRASLFASLSPVDATTTQEVARLQGNIEEVEARYRDFSAGDIGPQLEAQLEGLTRELTDGRAREGQLRRDVAAARARTEVLEAQVAPVPNGEAPNAQAVEPAQAPPAPAEEAVEGGAALEPALLGVLNAQRTLRSTQRPQTRAQDALPTDPYGGLEAELTDFVGSPSLSNESVAVLNDLAAGLAGTATETLRRTLQRQDAAQQVARQAAAEAALQDALLGYMQVQQRQAPLPEVPVQQPPEQQAPENPGQGDQLEPNQNSETLALLAAVELQTERVALAGMQAELDALQNDLAGYGAQAGAIQQEIAALNQERGRLNRELESALGSYSTVADLQSSVSYLTELAPTNARILSEASVPTSPVGPRRTFNTALAVLLGALLGLLLVFLRAAIRQPKRPTPPAARKVNA